MDFCQWQFKAFWLYGAVEPLTGEHFICQFSHVDTDCYQQFLNEFSPAYPDSLNILQVDNGRFHKAKRLLIPENIILLFQPPHCPELNPRLAVMAIPKSAICALSLFEDFTQLQTKVDQLLAELTTEVVASITGYPFILEALSVANII